MKMIPLVLAMVIAVAAAGFAWQKSQAVEEARVALADVNAQLQKAQTDLKTLSAEVAPLRKESAELKAAFEQQRAELAAAKGFLDAERTTTARIRDELAAAKEQIAFMSRSRAAQSAPSRELYPAPTLVRPATPMRIEAAPAPAPQRNAVRAQ